jgi:DNA-binding transcriptional MocR family regulator
LDKSTSIPVYRQIAERLRELIASGELAEGERLPASRELAKSLGVNRITVTAAYDRLERRGLVEGHVGRGTFVCSPRPEGASEGTGPTAARPSPQYWASQSVEDFDPTWIEPVLHAPKGTIFLDYALPPTELFLVDQFRRCLNDALKKDGAEALQMGPTGGYAPLREYIAGYMTKAGMPTRAEQVLVTNGCQQGLDLVRRVFVGNDDAVLLEEPTYPGAINIFSGGRIRRLSAPIGEAGMEMGAVEAALSHNKVKLIYTIPDFQNPTGATMTSEKRRRLLELAKKHGALVVEDGTYLELRYDGRAMPSIKALDKDGIALHLNSFSKINFPGIRVGWIAGPREAIERLEAAKRTCDLHTDLLAQTGLHEFCSRGLLDKHLKRARKVYRERKEAMVEALERHLPSDLKWIDPEGGLALWLTLPDGIDSERLLRAAVARGVAFSCGKGFYSGPPDPRTLRLCFAAESPETIRTGIKRLSLALKDTLAETKRAEAHRSLSGRPML